MFYFPQRNNDFDTDKKYNIILLLIIHHTAKF